MNGLQKTVEIPVLIKCEKRKKMLEEKNRDRTYERETKNCRKKEGEREYVKRPMT